MTSYDGTIRALVEAYSTDEVSPLLELRYRTRQNYIILMKRIERDRGTVLLSDIKYRELISWHKTWSKSGTYMAHALMGMLRTLVGFGIKYLEDEQCARIAGILHLTKFPMGKPREHHLTAQQVKAICDKAREMDLPMVALAQAFQFEGTFRQKDVIGEYVPREEDVEGYIEVARYGKWLRGLRWEEIDANLILTHITSKKQKRVTVDLKEAPMVMLELTAAYCELGDKLTRGRLPKSGPIIINSKTGFPYSPHTFRETWRKVATAAGVPKGVYNMDSRAGAITEATNAGATLEDARHAAAHSNTATTAKYSRDQVGKTARVMKLRAASRGQSKETMQ